jgi:hypothetical protein
MNITKSDLRNLVRETIQEYFIASRGGAGEGYNAQVSRRQAQQDGKKLADKFEQQMPGQATRLDNDGKREKLRELARGLGIENVDSAVEDAMGRIGVGRAWSES